MTFEELKITRQFLNALDDLGFSVPTPIQEKAIPVIRSGQHVIGIAQTGTGKTAAYVLPILQKLKYAQGTAPRAVVLVPTRELVLQVEEQVNQLKTYTDLRCVGIYGGIGKTKHLADLAKGVDILITTPRRMMNLYQLGGLVLNKMTIMVLDEADRMLDMGFMPQINLILDIVPRKKQNLLFSATFSPRVEKLTEDFLDFPIKIEIAPESTTAETIEQFRYNVENLQTKINLLTHLFKDEEAFYRILVFVKTKKTANNIAEQLGKKVSGDIQLIHSNKGQSARLNAINAFKGGGTRLLIATDVAARGIDVTMVSHVINFDVPIMHEDYIHRVGRTGRADNKGIAITFVNEAEVYHFKKIENKIRMSIPILDIPETVDIAPTPFDERQAIAKAIDDQKRRVDPNFKGAFHEKTKRPKAKPKKGRKGSASTKKKFVSQEKRTDRPKTSKKGRHKKK